MSDCIQWAGPIDRFGYGKASYGRLAHRVAYEAAIGPIPAGLELDHLCGVRSCVNPEHLEPVTHAENVRRAVENGSFATRAPRPSPGECASGHRFDNDNTYIRPDGSKQCRACNRAAVRRYKQRKAIA